MWNNFTISTTDEETLSNALCSCGIFKIFGEEKVTQLPKVQACVENKRMVISVDKSIVLLEDENVVKCSFVSFKSRIDSFVISQQGNIIICALSDGNIHGVFIKGVPVFHASVKAEDASYESTFIGIQRINEVFYITCKNGAVYRLQDINESELDYLKNESLNENETCPFEETLIKNVALDRLREGKKGLELTSCTLQLIENPNDPFYLISTSSSMIYFQNYSENIKICLPDIYHGVKCIYNLEHYIIALSNSGHLFQICPQTKMIFNIFDENVNNDLIDELIVIENNDGVIELMILTKMDQYEKRFMKLINFPSFKYNHILPLQSFVWLVSQPRNSVNIYYLSGENLSESNLPQEIEMKLISETEPEQRMKKLIQKGLMEEAEEFGKQYNLSLQPIYEAKARRLLSEIQYPSNVCNTTEDVLDKNFGKLLDILKQIESKEFFRAIRSAELPDRTITSKYLKEMLNHLGNDEKYEVEILEIKEQQLRLETLNIIDPYECYLEWQKFIHQSNMIKICTKLFKTDILTAGLIWRRHSASIIPHLHETDVMNILNIIPATAELFEVIQWLRQFVPSVLQTYPKSMPLLVEWCIEKIRSLQYSNLWPEVGLEFTTNVETIFNDVNFLYSDINRQYESSMEKIQSLLYALQNLFDLKETYNLILTLDNYLKNSLDETALRILQRVQINKLEKVVKDFLNPIYMKKGQSPNHAIIKYIQFLVTNRKGISFWLDRAVASIELLHNEEEKLQYALLILKCAPVPWPNAIQPLIKLRNSSHPLATDIVTECELQIIKIIKVKYGWSADSTDCNNLKLIFRIIKMNYPEMERDLKDVVKAAPEIGDSANFYCCQQLVRRGEIQRAIDFLNELEEKQQYRCIEKCFNIFLNVLQHDDNETANNENYIEFLKFISPRLNIDDELEFEKLQVIKILKNDFHLKVNISDLKNKQRRIDFLKYGCMNIVQILNETTDNIINIAWNKIYALSTALDIGTVFGIVELSKQFNNIHVTSVLAYNVLELMEVNPNNFTEFIDLAVLLIYQQIEVYIEDVSDVSNIEFLAYPLAYKLLVKALTCGRPHQLEILEILNWVQIGNNVYKLTAIRDYYENQQEVEKSIMTHLKANLQISVSQKEKRESISIFEEVCNEKETKKQTQSNVSSVLKCLSYCLVIIILELKPKESALQRICSYLKPAKYENSLENLKKQFFENLEHLIKSKNPSWYAILQSIIQYQQQSSNPPIIPEIFASNQLKKMLQYYLSQKNPNFIELFAMLICDSNPRLCLDSIENKIKCGQHKINFLKLSEMYNTCIGNVEKITTDRDRQKKYYYYIELCQQDVNLKNKFDIDSISISQIMKELRNRVLDVSLLLQLSRDFDWDYQELLISQITSILKLQELKFEIKSDELGKEELVIKISADKIREQCQPYINEITNFDLLAAQLLHFIKEINFYFYELYLCVIDILKDINALPKEFELWKDILLFLKHKMTSKRRQRPGQMETDWWLKSQLEVGVLPKIAKYRFPFIPIVQEPLKNILDDEVSVDNCVCWFPLIELRMTLQGITSHFEIMREKEHFCMSAVKNSILEYKQQNEETDTDLWHLQPLNNAFLQSILRLITHMVDLTRILFILYFVTNHAHDGADQVEAAYECYNFAMKYEKELSSNERAKEIVTKIKRKYPIFKTQHLLHIYGLVDDRLLRLVENPEELINALYHHEIILKPNKSNINKVAEEIATLHGLRFNVLQKNLLQKWLAFAQSSTFPELDDTFYEDLNTIVASVEDVNDEYVLRAHYILSSWNSEKAADFLISHIFPVNGTINTSQQLQMFECFSKLINESHLSFVNSVHQKQYIIIKCVHNLKQLGYNFTVDKFKEYDKLSILKKIWRNHANNSHALEIISHICLGFDIYISQIWNGVLKQMVNLNMVKQLNALVDTLSCKPNLLNTEGLAKAWECVLREPFRSANRTRSPEQEALLHKNLFRIQSCPLVGKLNLNEIAEDCLRLDRLHMAAILLAFCATEQRDKIMKMVKQGKDKNLEKDILELQDVGILPTIINYVLRILNL